MFEILVVIRISSIYVVAKVVYLRTFCLMQVVELLVRKLENEPNLHHRVNLFFLVDSIMQRSHSQKGILFIFFERASLRLWEHFLTVICQRANFDLLIYTRWTYMIWKLTVHSIFLS